MLSQFYIRKENPQGTPKIEVWLYRDESESAGKKRSYVETNDDLTRTKAHPGQPVSMTRRTDRF